MTSKQVSEMLGVSINNIKKSKGTFTYFQSYFFGFMSEPDKLVDRVRTKIPTAKIIGSGNHFHAFVDEAKPGSSKDSFLWVNFSVK